MSTRINLEHVRVRLMGITDLNKIHDHVPLTAITDEVTRQIVDKPIVNGLICEFDGVLEEVIALVQFIPEEQV